MADIDSQKFPMLENIKAVTFDVGGTLIRPWPSVGHVYAEIAARHGVTIFSPEQLTERFKTAWRTRQPFDYSRGGWAQLVDEVFGDCEPPSGKFFPELYDWFAEPQAWQVFEDVIPTLEALHSRNIPLGIISNWDERLPGLLRKLKLDRYFEAFAISYDVGFPKPSRVIFREAARMLDLKEELILHVGDSFEMDIEGAQAAGFQAVQIHRSNKTAQEDGLHSLTELLKKVA